jgi:hypothetical protein
MEEELEESSNREQEEEAQIAPSKKKASGKSGKGDIAPPESAGG